MNVRQRGAAAIEFQIMAILVLIPLLMAVMQLGMFMIARNTVNLATLGAARAGGASGGDRKEMRHAFAVGLAPLHVSQGKDVSGTGFKDISSANYALVMGAAYASARLDVANPVFSDIKVLNPGSASFADFGIDKPSVGRVIPVTNLVDDHKVGASSGQSRADALLLKIETRYCYRMVFPVIDDLIVGVLNAIDSGASAEDRACYLLNRVPIVSQAVVRMTVPPVQANLAK